MATELRFPVELDDSQASKDLDKLVSKIGKLKDSMAKTEAARTPIVNQLKEAQTEADETRARIEELKSALAESEYKTSPGGVTDPDTFNAELQKQTQIKAELAQQEQILQAKEKAVQKLQAQDSKLQTTLEQQTAELERQSAKAQELAQELSAAGKRSNFKEKISAAVSGLKDRAKSLFSKGGDIDGAVKSIGDSFGSSLKRVLAFGVGIRSLYALFNKLRKYITEGIQNFAQYDTETSASINGLKAALSGLQASWGAAFAPILNAVAPMLQTLISWLNAAAAAVAAFMAAISGKGTFKRAITNTDKLSSGLGGAADNAKEAKKQLMGIDELNVLQDNDTGGGGGGGGGADNMFEDVEVDADSLPARIAAALKAGEWAEAATILTDKLNEMVASVDWAGIGSKIGYYLNGALTFLATALTTFDWAALAGGIAVLLSNVISNVDWTNLGILFTAKFRILLLGAVGFFLNFDWGALAQGFSQFAIGFLNGIADAISQVDWALVGAEIWNQFVNIVNSIDWAGVATAALNLLGAAFVAVSALLGSFIGSVYESIVNFFNEHAADGGKDIVLGLLNGIIDAIAGIGEWIKENIFQPFIDGFKAAFEIGSPSKVMQEMGGYLMDGLGLGITEKIAPVIDKITEIKDKTISKLQELMDNAKSLDWASIGSSIVNGIHDGLNAGWEWLKSTVSSLAQSLLSTAKSVLGIHSPSKAFRDQIGENIGAGIEEGIGDSEGGLMQRMKNISAGMLQSFNDMPTSLASRIANIQMPPLPAVAMGSVVPPNAVSGSYGGISPELAEKLSNFLDRFGKDSGSSPIEVYPVVELDGVRVSKQLHSYTKRETKMHGKALIEVD